MVRKIETAAVFLLLTLLPTQLGYHFWPNWSLINGIRVDYLSPTLYLTDVIIVALVFLHGQLFKIPKWAIILAVINVAVAANPPVALYRWGRVYEYYWLYRYLIANWNWPLLRRGLGLAIGWTATLAVMQLVGQKSVGGWLYWLGERTFSITTPGIARVQLAGQLLLRPYATLPHPNALAGWLLVAGLIDGGWQLIVSLLTIPLTFSRTVIFLLPFGLWRKSKILALSLSAAAIWLLANLGNPASLPERQLLNYQALQVIKQAPLFGVGLGNFVYFVPAVRQPVHNIYLLLAAELGLPAAILIVVPLLRYVLKVRNFKLQMAYIGVLVTGLFDHYWLTLPQNLLLLTLLFAVVKINGDATTN